MNAASFCCLMKSTKNEVVPAICSAHRVATRCYQRQHRKQTYHQLCRLRQVLQHSIAMQHCLRTLSSTHRMLCRRRHLLHRLDITVMLHRHQLIKPRRNLRAPRQQGDQNQIPRQNRSSAFLALKYQMRMTTRRNLARQQHGSPRAAVTRHTTSATRQ